MPLPLHRLLTIFVALLLLPTSQYFAQEKKVAAKTISAINLRKIDTLLKPISAITAMYHADVQKARRRVDMLDGEEDNQVKNYSSPSNDEWINKYILTASQHAANYIENETLDKQININLNSKKRYLVQIKNNLAFFLDNLKSKKHDQALMEELFARVEDIAEATKQGKYQSYVEQHYDINTYWNKDLLGSTSPEYSALLNAMCKSNPQLLGGNLKELQKYSNVCDVINYLAVSKSNEILNYIMSTSSEKQIVAKCNNPLIKSMESLASESKDPLKAVALLGCYQRRELNIAQIDAIAGNDDTYFGKLIELHQADEKVSRTVIERDLKRVALDYVRKLNELHDASEALRFKCLEKLGPRELYFLIIAGSAELYTSSYLGIYKRLMIKVKPRTGFDLIQLVQQERFRTFLRMAANYNTLSDFLNSMPKEKQLELMDAFVSGLGAKKAVDLEGAVDVADSFGSIGDSSLLKFLQQKVNASMLRYQNEDNKKLASLYGILNSLFNTSNRDSANATLQQTLKLPSLNSVPLSNLYFDTSTTVYEQMFFYGDDDGIVGYNSFLGTFDRKKWKLDQSNPEWTVISSIGTKVPLVIYANKPLKEPNDEFAQQHLIDYLIEKDIHPTIMVHRGHSYHLKSTIQALNYENKIIILGSCGGYQNLNDIIQHCPDGHIVSTKQVGVFKVNTPIIGAVHNAITNGQDVDWVNMWRALGKQFKGTTSEDFFNDYVPPHKNLGSLFLKAYNKLNAIE